MYKENYINILTQTHVCNSFSGLHAGPTNWQNIQLQTWAIRKFQLVRASEAYFLKFPLYPGQGSRKKYGIFFTKDLFIKTRSKVCQNNVHLIICAEYIVISENAGLFFATNVVSSILYFIAFYCSKCTLSSVHIFLFVFLYYFFS